MIKQKIIRIASDPYIATEQVNEAIANLDGGGVFHLEVIYPDTVMFNYNAGTKPSDYKFRLLRIASDPDIATEQINDAIKALGDVSVLDVYGIYPDTVIIVYNPSYNPPNYRVKVLRIASDPDMVTDQINEAIEDIHESYEVGDFYTYVLYPDTLLYLYDYSE